MGRFLALVVALGAGCAPLFVEPLPAKYDYATAPRCTTNKGALVLDALIGGVAGFDAIYLTYHYDALGGGDRINAAIAINALAWVVHLSAGVWGEAKIDECRKAVAEYDRRQATPQPVPADVAAPAPARLAGPAYCTASPADSAIGACHPSLAGCRYEQRRLAAEGLDVGACLPQDAAVCFATVDDPNPSTHCAPTVMSCERIRAVVGEAYGVGPCE